MVRVCGVGFFEGAGVFLYVVDGMFVDDIDFFNLFDIEMMLVLKDVFFVVIYGVRVGNGVVLIMIKFGFFNQVLQILYDGYYGI